MALLIQLLLLLLSYIFFKKCLVNGSKDYKEIIEKYKEEINKK